LKDIFCVIVEKRNTEWNLNGGSAHLSAIKQNKQTNKKTVHVISKMWRKRMT
jgi:hypothetical protein